MVKSPQQLHFAPPVSLGPDDIVPAVAVLASGLAPRGRFRSSIFRRHLQTVAANFVAANDLTGLPPYGAAEDADRAWSERFHVHPQQIVTLLGAWEADGAVRLIESGRDRLFELHPQRGVARFLECVVRCDEGLRTVRPDLLLLSLTIPSLYPFSTIAAAHPSIRQARAEFEEFRGTKLSRCWQSRWVLHRIEEKLKHRRQLLIERARGVELLRDAIAPGLDQHDTLAQALDFAHAHLPSEVTTVYPGVFAWKKQRSPDLDSGLDRLAALYRTLPDDLARRDFLVGMQLRSTCLYSGMAQAIGSILALLHDVGEHLAAHTPTK